MASRPRAWTRSAATRLHGRVVAATWSGVSWVIVGLSGLALCFLLRDRRLSGCRARRVERATATDVLCSLRAPDEHGRAPTASARTRGIRLPAVTGFSSRTASYRRENLIRLLAIRKHTQGVLRCIITATARESYNSLPSAQSRSVSSWVR